MENEVLSRIKKLENKYNRLKIISLGVFSLLLVIVFGLGFISINESEIIRTKGIIIEDENGIDRILIGAPIPFSKYRVRTDTSLVRKYWSDVAGVDANQYMKWYNEYYHGTEGIVIMNEEGFDRVLLGDKLADSNVGKRLFEAAGITWNDKKGFELGGAGVNTTEDGTTRSVMGLDNPNGEAIHLVALEDGTNALIIGGANGRMMIGLSEEGGMFAQDGKSFSGIEYFNNNGDLVWEKQMNEKK
jgi:hypothetical protein